MNRIFNIRNTVRNSVLALFALAAFSACDEVDEADRFLDEGLCHFLSRRVSGGTINYGIRSAQKKVYVLVSFFARPFVSLVSHIVRYAPSFSDKGAFLRKLHST